MRQEFYYIRVDINNNWTPEKYRKVTPEELDVILDKFGNKVLRICSNGAQGAMTMWACFKNVIGGGCYGDMINAYRLLTNDNESLVTREHELRHAWLEYEELFRIRYYGSVENYYLARAKKARETQESYLKEKDK